MLGDALKSACSLPPTAGKTLANGKREAGTGYVPSFRAGIHHFCVHAGGRAVLDTVKDNLNVRCTPTAGRCAVLLAFLADMCVSTVVR